MSFRYPANWKRLDCEQSGSFQSTLTYLTNAPSAACYPDPPGESSSRPPAIRLGAGGILVKWWDYAFLFRGVKFPRDAATIGGMPARVGKITRAPGQPQLTSMCSEVRAEASQFVVIHRPPPGGSVLIVTACFRGPNVATNERAVKRMLASVRFAKG